MSKLDIQKVITLIEEVAQQEIVPRFGRLRADEIAYKQADDLVTAADEEVERILTERLTDMLPGALVVGEEACFRNPSIVGRFAEGRPVFVIDPVDGTKHFAEGRSGFFTMVSLIEKNEIIAGFVHHPLSGETLTAEKGGGAWLNGKKLHALASVPLREAKGTIGQRVWHKLPEERAKFQAALPSIECNPISGFAAPRLLTSGTYFGLTETVPQMHFRCCPYWSTPWDDAAALLAYAEGGGTFCHWDGQPYQFTQFRQGLVMAPDRAAIEEIRSFFAPYDLRSRFLQLQQTSHQ
ncbi:inositol monophosphatase family protein [Burkholderia sp. L27(2015)]|uniref:inositol monophosphatase family protein n=1 Tax=Burkholderia sp. L27(2015) TaxID=1641858 RepID=UPI00131BA0E7|nr:inositol monophosphatase family protein [Burkholderia sp. L27(2015)]